ncbi:MAG: hypothetical protein Q9187_002144 [Circinaria calcarea]
MSFGFSASDLAFVIQLAARAYTKYTNSAREFGELAEEAVTNESGISCGGPRGMLMISERVSNASVQEFATKLNDLLKERSTGSRQGSPPLESPTRSKIEDEPEWNQISQKLADLGVAREDIQVVGNICKQSLGQKQPQFGDISPETITQNYQGEMSSGDAHVDMDLAKSFSTSSTLASIGELEQTQSIMGGYINKSGEARPSLWDSLSGDVPLAFSPSRQQSKRSKSVASDSFENSTADSPVPSRRKLSLLLPKITAKLGSSATSIRQQPPPFEGNLTPEGRVPE